MVTVSQVRSVSGYTDTGRKETHHRVRECGRLYRHKEKGSTSQGKGMWQVIQAQGEKKHITGQGNVAGYTRTRRKEAHHRVKECGRLYRHKEEGNRSQSKGISNQNLGWGL
jgi:hypothetical protein